MPTRDTPLSLRWRAHQHFIYIQPLSSLMATGINFYFLFVFYPPTKLIYQMETLTLKVLHLRGQESFGVPQPNAKDLEYAVRKIKGIHWSGSYQLWYLPLTKEHYLQLKAALEGKATLNNEQLKAYLQHRKSLQPLYKSQHPAKKTTHFLLTNPLVGPNLEACNRFVALLQLKNYSPRTIQTYTAAFHSFLSVLRQVDAATLSKERVQAYLVWRYRQGYSTARMHTSINALKFYYEHVEGRPKAFYLGIDQFNSK